MSTTYDIGYYLGTKLKHLSDLLDGLEARATELESAQPNEPEEIDLNNLDNWNNGTSGVYVFVPKDSIPSDYAGEKACHVSPAVLYKYRQISLDYYNWLENFIEYDNYLCGWHQGLFENDAETFFGDFYISGVTIDYTSTHLEDYTLVYGQLVLIKKTSTQWFYVLVPSENQYL